MKGKGPVEADCGLILDARFKVEHLNLPLLAKINVELHQFPSESLLPVAGVDRKIEELGFALHHAKADKSNEGGLLSLPGPEGKTSGVEPLDLFQEGLP